MSEPRLIDSANLSPALTRRNLLRAGAWGMGGVLLGGCSASPMALAGSPPAPSWDAIAKMAEDYVDQRKVANFVAAMGFGQNDAQYISRGRLALGSETDAGADSLYRIYSMTKPVTGLAVAMLIDAGKLQLDQPLKDVLPAFADMQVQATPDGNLTDLVPAQRDITIRHLLTHTAGLGYNITQKGEIAAAYNKAGISPGKISRIPIPGIARATPAPSLEIFADRLATLPLVYQPGTKWSYSVSLDLLGRVIEVVSGKPFDSFLQDEIFGPAGMTSTYFTVPQSEVNRLTTNYGLVNGTLLPIDPAKASIFLDEPEFPFGGAGLVSSPRDYDQFHKLLVGYGMVNGRRVVSEGAIRLATQNLLPDGVSMDGTWVEGQGFGAGGSVGLGENAGMFGWGGAAGTVALVNMRTGLRAGMFVQYMPPESLPMRDDFIAAMSTDIAAFLGNSAMKAAA